MGFAMCIIICKRKKKVELLSAHAKKRGIVFNFGFKFFFHDFVIIKKWFFCCLFVHRVKCIVFLCSPSTAHVRWLKIFVKFHSNYSSFTLTWAGLLLPFAQIGHFIHLQAFIILRKPFIGVFFFFFPFWRQKGVIHSNEFNFKFKFRVNRENWRTDVRRKSLRKWQKTHIWMCVC